MYKLAGIILLFFIFSYCTEDPLKFRNKQPIPKNDLVLIITEMHLMDALTSQYDFYRRYSSKDTLDVYGAIFEKYGYTRVEFDSTISNYSKNPALYERVYNEVLLKLNFILDTLKKNDPQFEDEGMEIKKGKEGFVY